MYPLVSIVIPAYNVEKTIARAIESVLAQSIRDWELIVVNDASTDETAKKVDAYAQTEERMHVISFEKNSSVFMARKYGVQAARGKYLMFLDADDALLPYSCEEAVRLIRHAKTDIVQFGTKLVKLPGAAVSDADMQAFEEVLTPCKEFLRGEQILRQCYQEHAYPFTVWNKIFRMEVCKQAYKALPDAYINMADDLLAYFAIAYFAQSFCGYPKKILYCYSVGGGMSTQKRYTLRQSNRQTDILDAISQVEHFLKVQDASAHFQEAFHAIQAQQYRAVLEPLADFVTQAPRSIASQAVAHCTDKIDPVVFCDYFARKFWHVPARLYRVLTETFTRKTAELKTLHTIGTYYHRMYNGGVERVLSQLIPLWHKMGYHVVLFTDEPENELDYAIDAPYTRVVLPGVQYDGSNFEKRAQVWKDAIEQFQIDAIIYHGWGDKHLPWDMLIAKLCGCRFGIHTHLSVTCFQQYPAQERLFFRQWQAIYPFADCVLTLNGADDVFWQSCGCKAVPVNNPMWLYPTYVVEPKAQCRRILWIARISTEKQPFDIVPIMRRIVKDAPQIQLILVGGSDDPVLQKKLEDRIGEAGLQDSIRLAGFQSDVSSYYEQCDVMLMTSWIEGYSMTLRESAQFGMPTVMYDLPYLFARGTDSGVLRVAQGDVKAAADALLALIHDDVAFRILSQGALARAMQDNAIDREAIWQDVFARLSAARMPQQQDPIQQMAEECKDALEQSIWQANNMASAAAMQQNVNYGTRYYLKHAVGAAMLRVLGKDRWDRLYDAYARKKGRSL